MNWEEKSSNGRRKTSTTYEVKSFLHSQAAKFGMAQSLQF
jgi:hypothetical protein